MISFKFSGKKFTPLAPGSTPPDGVDVLELEPAAVRAGKSVDHMRKVWIAKWGQIVPQQNVIGEPVGDPMQRSAEVKHAALAMTDEQKDELIRQMLYPQLPKEDAWPAFKEICARRRLSIYSRDLYPEYRYDGKSDSMVLVIMTTIQALRKIARRTGVYRGRTPIKWAGPDAKYVAQWRSDLGPPTWARVGVRRKGDPKPTYEVAEWSCYVPWVETKDGPQWDPYWATWSAAQLGKCVEARALRATFEEDLDGLFIREEMRQADNFGKPKPPAPKRSSEDYDDSDSQLAPEAIDEEEFAELLSRYAPDPGKQSLVLSSFKIKYARLWRQQSPLFYQTVARDLREMIKARAG